MEDLAIATMITQIIRNLIVAIVFLLVMFSGDPDLVDAIIQLLSRIGA